MMKKSLVAVAVLAACSASFAQVTISGKLGFSYQKNAKVPTGAANHGLQVSDGDIGFKAVEDIGGGVSVSADTRMKLRGRDTTVTARDAILGVKTNSFGLTLSASEVASPLFAGHAGAPVSLATGHDNDANQAPLDATYNADAIALSIPFGAFTGSLTYSEVNNGKGIFGTNTAIGTADTAGGNNSGLTSTGFNLAYAAGPVAIALDHTVFAAGTPLSAAYIKFADGLSRTTLTGTYDFGMAKVGMGVQTKNSGLPSQYTLGVNVPVGAFSFGLIYSARNSQTADAALGLAAEDARSATAVGMDYNFSKTTALNVSYGTYTGSNKTANAAANLDNEYRIRLMKKF